MVHKQEVNRFLGLSLGGAKSDKTSLTVIDYYRAQSKAFVVDVFEGIGPEKSSHTKEELTADQVLLELIAEYQPGIQVLATDVALTLPPCLNGCEKSCKGYEKCKRPYVKWMAAQYRRAKIKHSKLKHFTPYSQRPVDVYFRYKHMEEEVFQDETLGANLAPQTARMQYLKEHLKSIQLIEVWPKLTLFYLQKTLKLTHQEVLGYRHLEEGLRLREKILERLVETSEIFIYERDFKKIMTHVSSFDSFLCAWVALLYYLDKVMKFGQAVPLESGWVQIPEI